MDVDEDDDGTQRPKKVHDFGIEVDFEGLDDETRESGSMDEFDREIVKLNAEIERMAPNLKAIERQVFFIFYFLFCLCLTCSINSLDDVEAKLADTEREADKARKDSKTARDQFNDIKKRR